MATATAKPNTKDKILSLARAAGDEGIAVKDLASEAGVSDTTARKAVKALVEDGKVKQDGPGRVIAKTRVGRRSSEVVERDEKILAAIAEHGSAGSTLKDAAFAVDTTERLAYESIWRLRAEGKLVREGSTRSAKWVAVS